MKNDSNNSIPRRRAVGKKKARPYGRPDFLDSALVAATEAALSAKLDEHEVILAFVTNLDSLTEFYERKRTVRQRMDVFLNGEEGAFDDTKPKWLAEVDTNAIADHLTSLQAKIDSEAEFYDLLEPLKGGLDVEAARDGRAARLSRLAKRISNLGAAIKKAGVTYQKLSREIECNTEQGNKASTLAEISGRVNRLTDVLHKAAPLMSSFSRDLDDLATRGGRK